MASLGTGAFEDLAETVNSASVHVKHQVQLCRDGNRVRIRCVKGIAGADQVAEDLVRLPRAAVRLAVARARLCSADGIFCGSRRNIKTTLQAVELKPLLEGQDGKEARGKRVMLIGGAQCGVDAGWQWEYIGTRAQETSLGGFIDAWEFVQARGCVMRATL